MAGGTTSKPRYKQSGETPEHAPQWVNELVNAGTQSSHTQSPEVHDPQPRLDKLPRFLSHLAPATQSFFLFHSSHASIVTGAADQLPSTPLP